MSVTKRKGQWGHYPPVVPEIQKDDSGIAVAYNDNGALEFSTDYGLLDTGTPGDGIIFTGPDVVDGSYEISIDPIYFDANYLRNDGDTGVGDYEFTGALTNNGNQVWHPGNDGSGSGLDADKLHGLTPDTAESNSTIVARNSSGDIFARTFQASFATQAGYPGTTADIPFRNDATSDKLLRFMDQQSMNAWVHQKDSGCVCTKGSAHSFPTGVHTVFIAGTEDYDKRGEYSPSTGRFSPIESGYYAIFGRVMLQSYSWTVGQIGQASVFINGVQDISGQRWTATSTAAQRCHFTVGCIIYIAAGSYADVRIFHNQGTTLSSYTDVDYCGITIGRIA